MDSGFGDDVCVQAVAEVDGVDVVTGARLASASQAVELLAQRVPGPGSTHHSKSLYMIVKKT